MSTIVRSSGAGGGSTGTGDGSAAISPNWSDASGATDATAAFAAAYATGKPVSVPPGDYFVTSLAPFTKSHTYGHGADQTRIHYVGTGTMCTLTNHQRTKFSNLTFVVADAAGVAFTVSNSFRCSWTRCVFQGNHTAAGDGYASTTGHIGVVLTGNSGDNLFYDTDFLNLGVGIKTDCIQNGVLGGKFGNCYKGIYATGGGGMSLTGYIDFVAAVGATPPTDTAIDINGATGQWWIDGVWIEGCTTGVRVGAGTSGPAQFSMSNSKVAAVTTCIDMACARNPTLFNVYCAGDNANAFTPDPFVVNATNAPEGVAYVDSIITGKAIAPTAYPAGWMVHARSGGTAALKVPNETDLAYGAKLRMARSDGTYTDTLQQTGGPRLLIGAPSSNATEAVLFRGTGGESLLGIDAVSSPVNYLAVTDSPTTVGPAVLARGGDTNVNLLLTPKGTGDVVVGGGLKLPTYATGSLPTASAHPNTLAYDSSVGQPKFSDGSTWSAMGGAAAAAPAPRSGNYFYPVGSGSTTTNTLPNGTAYAVPWELGTAVTLTSLGIDVTAAGDSGCKIRLMVYADTGSWYPGALVLDAGQVAGDAVAVPEITISQALTAGTYWFAAAGQSITTTAPTVRQANAFTPRLPLALGTSAPGANTLASSYVATGVTTTAPSTWTSTVGINSRAPRLIAKAA